MIARVTTSDQCIVKKKFVIVISALQFKRWLSNNQYIEVVDWNTVPFFPDLPPPPHHQSIMIVRWCSWQMRGSLMFPRQNCWACAVTSEVSPVLWGVTITTNSLAQLPGQLRVSTCAWTDRDSSTSSRPGNARQPGYRGRSKLSSTWTSSGPSWRRPTGAGPAPGSSCGRWRPTLRSWRTTSTRI